MLIAALMLALAAPQSQADAASIADARSAVAEMRQLATTPEEKALAERDHAAVEKAARLVEQRAAALAAGKSAQETQMSFSMQYLQLQSKMQDENRRFTTMSNIMKTKHDTVKNSISNIR